MARTIDDFWLILDEIQGESTELTDAIKSIAKNEKTVSERLFTNIIDQIAYNSKDYTRIRSFLRDWYAAHRTITTFQANVSDIYQMPNDQLDDLFESFGYPYSTGIRDPISNNPTLNKINFFLDLVNLYKIKGSPKALVDILQYYGIVDVDLYEMSLQFDDRPSKVSTDLIFKGKVVSGTTGDVSPIYLPFDLLTQGDPHWLQSESQIRTLFNQNIINFPSQSPYFTLKPLFNEEATDAATGILQRDVQDQHDTWEAAGFPPEDTSPVLPQDAIISITGDQCSLLTIYLASIYTFNRQYNVGAPATRFVCYDGTNTVAADIIDEFRDITQKPSNRSDQKSRLIEYLDQFTRAMSENFLQTHSDAGTILAILNPTVKSNLDGLATDVHTVLGTLLKDLGEWVRANISYGFINISYILFGMDSLFSQLQEVIEFFKPYRARIIPLEMLQLQNRLFNSIVVEDSFEITTDLSLHDYLIGDSIPCCSDATCSALYSPREYYDCGSYHDIGAVTDLPEEIQITLVDEYHDRLVCPSSDSTGYVVSELVSEVHNVPQVVSLSNGATSLAISYTALQPNTDYSLILNIYNETDVTPLQNSLIVCDKLTSGFGVEFSAPFDSANYNLSWSIIDSTSTVSISGIESIASSSDEATVTFSQARSNVNYSIALSLENLIDSTTTIFTYTITEKSVNGFTVKFSGAMPTANYSIGWTAFNHAREIPSSPVDGWIAIPDGASTVTVPMVPSEVYDNYTVAFSIVNTDDTSVSTYSYVVTEKTIDEFTVLFSGAMDSANYYLTWALPVSSNAIFESYFYRQEGQMRGFDDDILFDCTFGMDLVEVELEETISYLLKEDGSFLLQENDDRLLL
jgi:hypothetical protein